MKSTGRRARIVFLFVGRAGRGNDPLEAAFDDYLSRISRFEPTEVRRVRPSGGDDAVSVGIESRALLESVGDDGSPWVLDPRGRPLDTPAFAAALARDLEGRPPVTLVVGGAGGLDDSVRARAARLVSLSPMTLPHVLARVVAAEQVFRALTLRERVPYHK